MKNIAIAIAILASLSAHAALEHCPELVKISQAGKTTYWTKDNLAGSYTATAGERLLNKVWPGINDPLNHGSVNLSHAKTMAKALTKVCKAQLGDAVFLVPSMAEIRELKSESEFNEIFVTQPKDVWGGDRYLTRDRAWGFSDSMPVPFPDRLNLYYELANGGEQKGSTPGPVRYRAILDSK